MLFPKDLITIGYSAILIIQFMQEKIAITGSNGSGKSTLMRILSGQLSPSEGSVTFEINNLKLSPDNVFSNISFAAPYLELIEEFSLSEILHFQKQFKPLINNMPIEECIAISGLYPHRNKLLKIILPE